MKMRMLKFKTNQQYYNVLSIYDLHKFETLIKIQNDSSLSSNLTHTLNTYSKIIIQQCEFLSFICEK